MSEEEEDPLELRSLALNFDYLIYKIKDHISNLSEITYQSVSSKQQLINETYFKDQLNIENELKEINLVLERCIEIELNFLKLDQLNLFVNDFKSRLDYLKEEFDKLK